MPLTCVEYFERKGDRWDTRRDRAHPIVQASRETVDRTEREIKAQGYDGPVRKPRYKRDPKAEPPPPAMKTRAQIERETWNRLNYAVPEPGQVRGRVYHAAPEEKSPFDRDYDADERRWREFLLAERARS
jgi:hypothetical protein